jgi:hypothetical protein
MWPISVRPRLFRRHLAFALGLSGVLPDGPLVHCLSPRHHFDDTPYVRFMPLCCERVAALAQLILTQLGCQGQCRSIQGNTPLSVLLMARMPVSGKSMLFRCRSARSVCRPALPPSSHPVIGTLSFLNSSRSGRLVLTHHITQLPDVQRHEDGHGSH